MNKDDYGEWSGLTTDPNDENITKGSGGVGQNKKYLVLSDEEKSKGFVRPVRRSYQHLTCGCVTTMNVAIAETYARDPKFYGYTFCVQCNTHLPVAEFEWTNDREKVGS